ncbi:MAG: type I 3-dehydroquinate dehydratase [Candidatus Lokiarchaeota archaeon]|nr:type I 3-dehydroquinate dehydratase [Candidatus Lokiarchaeota archaeon]
MKYKVCVAIPIKTGDIDVNKKLIEKALDNRPDLIEFRFDYIDEINHISPQFLKGLSNCIPPKILKIFTFRSTQEGGQYDLSIDEKCEVLRLLIETKPDYLDIEIRSESKLLKRLIDLAHENGVKLIFSYHNFEKCLSYEETTEILTIFNRKLTDELNYASDRMIDCVTKIIYTARDFDDNVVILNTCKKLSQLDYKFVCFAMGELGILSRILCVKFGSLWTYGSSEDKTAPGQVKIEKIREIHQLLFDN